MIRPFFLRLSDRLAERVTGSTLLRITLLWLALTCLAGGLLTVVQRLPGTWIFPTAWLGILLGWLLARSRRPGWKCALLALGCGGAWLVLAVGRMSVPLGILLSSQFKFSTQIFQHLIGYLFQHQRPFLPVDPNPVIEAVNGLVMGLVALFTRLVGWVRGTATGAVMIDPIVTNLVWCGVIWLISVWAAWCVRRKEAVFLGLLPAVALLAYNVYYINSRSGLIWLAFLAGWLLLLQALNGYVSAWERWQAARMDRAELEPGLTGAVLAISVALMVVALILPSLSIRDLQRAINRLIEARQNRVMAESLGLEQTPATGGGTGGGYVALAPSVHAIGPGPHLSKEVMLYVRIEDYVAIPAGVPVEVQSQAATLPLYWRSQTFDVYNGSGWVSYTSAQTDHLTEQPLSDQSVTGDQRLIWQNIQRVWDPSDTVFVSGELLTVNQPYHVIWRDSGDLIAAWTKSSSYRAESRLPAVSVSQLRSAGADYPPAIRARYLQLPENLPQRVRNLALDLTAIQSTPYDQATAIETYLRSIPYSLDVPAPPMGRDAVDFFLFDLKKGYCDYYASAMVVMVRAAGIPARVVTGYSRGEYDDDRGLFIVTAVNAHAWVEIYFPGYGWVEFEPTASQPAILRPGGEELTSSEQPSSRLAPGFPSNLFGPGWLRRLGLILISVLAGGLILLLLPIGSWSLLLYPADRAVTIVYHRLYRQGRSWKVKPNPARTPDEFAAELSERLTLPAVGTPLTAGIAACLADIQWLTGLYTRMLYGPHPPSPGEHRQAVWVWYRLRRRLAWVRLEEIFRSGKRGRSPVEKAKLSESIR